MERSGTMELERRRGKLRHLQEQHQRDLPRMPGQRSLGLRGLHDLLGRLQPRLPHALHQQVDHTEEKYLSALPEGLDYGQNCKIVIRIPFEFIFLNISKQTHLLMRKNEFPLILGLNKWKFSNDV